MTGRALGWRETAVIQGTCFYPVSISTLAGETDSECVLCHAATARRGRADWLKELRQLG